MGGGGAQRAKRVAYPPGLKKSQRDAIRRKRNRDCAQRIRDRQASDITMLEQQAAAVQQQQQELLRRHQQLEAANAELRRAGQAEMRALLQMLQAQERDSGSVLADAAPMIDPATLAQMAATMGVDLNEPAALTSATSNLRRDSVSSSVSSNNSQSSNGRADSAILMDDTPTSATATASAAADSVSSADLWKAAGAQVLLEYSPAASGSNGSSNEQGSPITPSAAVASSESNNSSLSPGLEAGSLMDWSADMLFGLLPPTTEAAVAGVAEVCATASASASADGAFSKPPRPSESLSFLDEYLQYDMVREAAWPQSVPLFVARPQLQLQQQQQQLQVPQVPQQPARFQTPLHQQFWWQRLQWLQQRQRQLQLQQQKTNQLPPQFWLPPPPRHPDHAAQMQTASSSSSSSSSSMQLLDQPSAHWQAAAAAAATQQGSQGLGSQHLSSHHYNIARDLDVLPFDDAPVLPSPAEDDVETDEEVMKEEEEKRSAAVEARGFWTFGSLCGSNESSMSSEEKQMCRGKRILRGIWRHCPAIKLLRLLMVFVLVPICRAAIRIVGKPAARVAAWAEEHKLPAAGAKNRLPTSNWVDLAFAALTSLAALLTVATAWLPQPQWKPRDPSDHSQQQQQTPPTKPRKAHHNLRTRHSGFTPSFPSFSHSFMSSSSAHEAVELLLLQLLLPLQNLAGVVVV